MSVFLSLRYIYLDVPTSHRCCPSWFTLSTVVIRISPCLCWCQVRSWWTSTGRSECMISLTPSDHRNRRGKLLNDPIAMTDVHLCSVCVGLASVPLNSTGLRVKGSRCHIGLVRRAAIVGPPEFGTPACPTVTGPSIHKVFVATVNNDVPLHCCT